MEEYTREFFRLSRYATDVLQDAPRAVELYVFGLGPEFMVFRPEGRSLESVVEEARQVERRYIRHGTMPDPYQSDSIMPTQIAQQLVFQLGSSDAQETGPSQPSRHFRTRREGRRSAHRHNRAARFGSRGGSNTSGQSSGQSSAGSRASACGICGRVHQGPCHLVPGACFRCGKFGHFA